LTDLDEAGGNQAPGHDHGVPEALTKGADRPTLIFL
jgi:hypothetical protein